MLWFALFLVAAGGVLSATTRVQGLLAILLGFGVACCAVLLVRSLDDTPAVSLGVTLVIAIVALQAGYGIGVVARASLGMRSRRIPRGETTLRGARHEPGAKAENPLGEKP